jgi:hypothetical protein
MMRTRFLLIQDTILFLSLVLLVDPRFAGLEVHEWLGLDCPRPKFPVSERFCCGQYASEACFISGPGKVFRGGAEGEEPETSSNHRP